MARYYFPQYRKNKYANTKIVIDGISFDSKREASRYQELKLLEKSGEITDMQRQVKYVLIPTQRAPSTVTKRGKEKPGKLLERECAYVADFVYKDKDGNIVVEDTKGVRTPDYVIKRKLMLYIHHIQIVEI